MHTEEVSRPETEASTIRIANLILSSLDEQFGKTPTTTFPDALENSPITRVRILDLCTGTGCIPLLLHAILSSRIPHLEIAGVDISPTAIALANKNLQHNIAQGHLLLAARTQIRFVQADIFDDEVKAKLEEEGGNWDIVISNPPYISPKGFNEHTSRSVRNYEPKIALVPSPSRDHAAAYLSNGDGDGDEATTATRDSRIGDSFYPQILKIASRVHAKTVLMEVSDLAQAKRVAGLGIRRGHWGNKCEIWRDWPDEAGEQEVGVVGQEGEHKEGNETEARISGVPVRIIGKGHGRSVFVSSSSSSLSRSAPSPTGKNLS